MKRKLIILYNQFYDYDGKYEKIGGIETYLKNLIEVANNNTMDSFIIQFGNNDFEHEYMSNTKVIGIKSHSKKDVKKLLKKAYQIGDLKNDILLFASSNLNVKNKFSYSLAIQHGIYWDKEKVKGHYFNKKITTFLKSKQIGLEIKRNNLVNNVICVDYNYINWYRSLTKIEHENLICIPNFVKIDNDFKHYDTDEYVSIIFARRFEDIRGIKLIEKAFKKIIKEYSNVLITIAGEGTYQSEIENLFKNDKNVNIICYEPSQSVEIHAKHDIAVVPSIASEGTSLSLLEAMSAGCAVIATNVGGMTNIVINNFNGLMINPNAEELYVALKKLIDDEKLRKNLANNGKLTVNSGFNLMNWQRSWSEILNGR